MLVFLVDQIRCEESKKTAMDNISVPFIFILFISLTNAHKVHRSTKLDISEKDTASSNNLPVEESVTGDKNENVSTDIIPTTDKVESTDKHSENRDANSGLLSGLELARPKRSMLNDEPYEPALLEEKSTIDRLRALLRTKRILSDYGYGSRLQAGESLARSLAHEGLFSFEGPGKRSAEVADFDFLNDETDREKRINTDYGYGSRLQAAENVAMDWDRNGLFGIMGPGKRSVISKRIGADFGYGSRFQAAKNAAKASHGELFGTHGPGKRSIEKALNSEFQTVDKRSLSDYGYGSRLKAGENVAESSSRGGLFGVHGPGKRSIDNFQKRFDSDFGYGSREQAAENIAKSFGTNKLFGVYGPGKRSGAELYRNVRGGEQMEADGGYGSRIQAGSQIAKDVVAINDVFGSFGPGRRKRAMEYVDTSGINKLNAVAGKYFRKRNNLAVDAGYGSRISTAARLARSSSVRDIFGSGGPGK